LFFLHTANADTLVGRVVGITDGDTLTLLDEQMQQHKIRFAGIDAPEKVQPFGSKSQTNLGQMAFNKKVTADCPKRDRYGRELCKVFVDGQDIGLQQIADGMAWWFVKYAKEQSPQDRAAYEQAETMAKLRRLGLWEDTNPTPPWDWRKLLKN
jgi:endonuclease YncB( thermonuclease family)